MQLTLRRASTRPTGQERMLLQVDDSTFQDTSRLSSCGVASTPTRRRLLSMVTPTPLDAYCPTETSASAQCACRSNSNVILTWSLRDCNQCVLIKSQACSSMGQQLTLAHITYTIGVQAPAGAEFTTNSIAVAQLKRNSLYPVTLLYSFHDSYHTVFSIAHRCPCRQRMAFSSNI